MRIHFRSNIKPPFSTAGYIAQLISSSLLSETGVEYEWRLPSGLSRYDLPEERARKYTFPPSKTRSLTEHGDGTWTYEERYTFGDRVDIIHFALAFGWTSSLEDDCLTYPPLGELLP